MEFRRDSRRTGTRAALAAATVVALASLAACADEPSTPVAAGGLAELEADAVIYEMDNYVEADGVRSARILADSAYAFNDSSVVKLWSVDMNVYHEDGRDRAHVTAERGTLDNRTEKFVARGNVVVQMADSPERIETPELHYDPQGGKVWSDSTTVRVLPDGRTTRGSCFESTLTLENVEVCDIRGAAPVPRSTRDTIGGRPGGAGAGGPGGPASPEARRSPVPDARIAPDTTPGTGPDTSGAVAGGGGGTDGR